MDFAIFDDTLDSIVLDPRQRVKDLVRDIVLRHTKNAPAEFVAELAAPRLRELGHRIKDLLEHGHLGDIDPLIRAFDLELTKETVHERTAEHGRLRPITAESEIKKHADLWARYRWVGASGYEQAALLVLIKNGDRIANVDYWKITMASGQVITRDQVRQVNRPRLTTERAWLANFISDETVRAAEPAEQREAAQLARPFRDFSGPRPVRD